MNLLEIADKVNQAFELSNQLYESGIVSIQQALTSDRNAGELLIEAKKLLPHGEFTNWVEINCKFGIRHAQKLMQIFKNWEKIITSWENAKHATRGAFESPLPSLRQAIALSTAEPKPEPTPPESPTKYKVTQPQSPYYGEEVEVVKELHHGDVVVCRTSTGEEFPFIKKELASPGSPIQEPEIIDVEVSDTSEKLKEAIALLLEYLPELQLKTLLAQALLVGKEYLPDEAQGMVAGLIGNESSGLFLNQPA